MEDNKQSSPQGLFGFTPSPQFTVSVDTDEITKDAGFDFNKYQREQVSQIITSTDKQINLIKICGRTITILCAQQFVTQTLFNAGYLGWFTGATTAFFPATSAIFTLSCIAFKPFRVERPVELAASGATTTFGILLAVKHFNDKDKASEIAAKGVKSFQTEIDIYEGIKQPKPKDNSFYSGLSIGVGVAILVVLAYKFLIKK
jgi:hypothetical protein